MPIARAEPEREAREAPARTGLSGGATAQGAGASLWPRLSTLPALQPTLEVGPVDDPYEREADRVADAVAEEAGSTLSVAAAPAPTPTVARRDRTPPTTAQQTTPVIGPGLASRLDGARGRGEPLAPDQRAFFEPRLGADLSGVRVHHDSGAAVAARELSANAFALGADVFFGAGRYSPAAPEGRRLLAHELTHVVQQGGTGAAGKTVRREPEGTAATAARDAEYVYHLVPEHPVTPAVVGQTMTYRLRGPSMYKGRRTTSEWVREWRVRPPKGEPYHRVNRQALEVSFDQPGTWWIDAAVWVSGRRELLQLSVSQVVEEGAALAERALGVAPEGDYLQYRVRLERQALSLSQGAVRQQNFGVPFISVTGDNPAAYSGTAWHATNNYVVHHGPRVEPASYRWYVRPRKWKDRPVANLHGFHIHTIHGHPAYDLGSTGKSARWVMAEPNVWDVYCDLLDARGSLLGTARYVQVVLTLGEHDALTRLREYMASSAESLATIESGKEVYLRAVHVATETGAITPLTLFMGPAATGRKFQLVDVTPGVPKREYEGDDFDDALKSFNRWNSYPTGVLRLSVSQNALGVKASDWVLETHGRSVVGTLSTRYGWISLGLAAGGVLAMVIPGGQVIAPALFIAAAGFGAASAALSLAERLQQAEPSRVGIAIDVLQVVGSLLGAAAAIRALRYGAALSVATRGGRFVLWAGFSTDVVSGILFSAEGAHQIATILDSEMSRNEKINTIVRIIGGLLLTGGLIALGARDLGQARRRMTELAGQAVAGKLSLAELHLLNVLDDGVLRSLAGASSDEIALLARVIQDDPARASRLLATHLDELRPALRRRDFTTLDELHASLATRGAARPHGTDAAVGGTRGPDVYPLTHMRPKDPTKGALGPKDLDEGVKALTKSARRGGATLTRISENEFLLTVPRKDGTSVIVEIATRSVEPGTIKGAPTQPHTTAAGGTEAGPARVEINRVPAPDERWRAVIFVDNRVHPRDLEFLIGHELDEVALALAPRTPATTTPLDPELAAGIFQRAASGAPTISAHDRAAASELFAMHTRIEQVKSQIAGIEAKAAKGAASKTDIESLTGLRVKQASWERSMAKLMDWMGLFDPANRELKMQALREAGLDPASIARAGKGFETIYKGWEARLYDLQRELADPIMAAYRAGLPPGVSTQLDTDLVAHLKYPRPHGPKPGEGDFTMGIHGGHDDAMLKRFVDDHPEYGYALVEEATHGAMGTTFHRYSQYVWKGTGPRPRPGDPGYPVKGGSGAPPTGWEVAKYPKTTVDDFGIFLREADAAATAWIAANGATFKGGPAARFQFYRRSPGGVEISGWMEFTPPDTFKVTTLFVAQDWVATKGAWTAPAPTGSVTFTGTTASPTAGTTTSATAGTTTGATVSPTTGTTGSSKP